MNLTTTSNLSKKYVPYILVALIIGSLILLVSYRLLHKTVTLPPIDALQISYLPQEIIPPQTSQLKKQGEAPNQALVYSITSTTSLLEKSGFLREKLGLSNSRVQSVKDIKKGSGEVFSTSEASLVIFPQSLSYQKVGIHPAHGNFDIEKLGQAAFSKLEELQLNQNLSMIPQIKYLKIQEEGLDTVGDESQANLVSFTYNYSLNNFQVVNQSAPVILSYDKDGQLFSIQYQQLPEVSTLTKFPIITIDGALKSLNTKKQVVVKIDPFTHTVASTKSFTDLSLTKVYLAYYLPTQSKNIQPIWVFEGDGAIAQTKVKVQIAVPAIQSNIK